MWIHLAYVRDGLMFIGRRAYVSGGQCVGIVGQSRILLLANRDPFREPQSSQPAGKFISMK